MKTSPFRNPNMSGSDENDWHEDFEHENGNYRNKCVVCGVDFIGHKRRVVCRVCDKPTRPMTDWEKDVTNKFFDLLFNKL